jgi:hypothetical protein
MASERELNSLAEQLARIKRVQGDSAKRDTAAKKAANDARILGPAFKVVGQGIKHKIERAREDIETIEKVYQTGEAGFTLGKKIWNKVEPSLRPLIGLTKKFYNAAAYRKKKDGSREFSPTRSFAAAAAIACTAFACVAYGVPATVSTVGGFAGGVAEFGMDAVLVNATRHHIKANFQLPRLTDSTSRTYEVGGCDESPCTPHNTTTYRIRDSYYKDLVEITKGNFGFYPDRVAGAITTPGAQCQAEISGTQWKWLLRQNWDWFYPKIWDISCNTTASTPPAPRAP